MKKFILGLVWQILGFLGATMIICIAAPQQWEYNGTTGLLGSLLGLNLMIPLVVCVVIFIIGVLFSYKGSNEK